MCETWVLKVRSVGYKLVCKYNFWSPIRHLHSMKPSYLCPLAQKLYVPFLFLLSSVLMINFLFFLLNLPPAEYGIISSSSSPREQNVALGIKLFNYSVSYRLANLTLSLLAPRTHQWYVCLHIRVCAACVGHGVYYCSCVCERSSWMASSWTSSTHYQSLIQLRLAFMHAVVCVSHTTCCHLL